jgi:hypothetical protein
MLKTASSKEKNSGQEMRRLNTGHAMYTGVFHNGFDRAEMVRAFEKTGFDEVRSRTAAETKKPAPGGGARSFTIFLVTGKK